MSDSETPTDSDKPDWEHLTEMALNRLQELGATGPCPKCHSATGV